ncbi:MAG: sigma 54-interacting transcriptional regulator [Rickettsiales bacterium]|nr:sigma 54-interacting transcriptional regulator [Rickettsiales bacterium]
MSKRIAVNDDRELIYSSAEIQKVVDKVNLYAPTEQRVLITGPNGTGKESIALLLHKGSKRADQPFVAVNCGAISEGLIESELFGHEKGAFTGAIGQKKGLFETAKDGTIFLDEIGEMPKQMQVKLLRVLEDGQFQRVGGTETIRARPRVIAATNINLTEAVNSGKFREDLYHRLGKELDLPGLKDRPVDIAVLAEHFAKAAAKANAQPEPKFAPGSLEKLKSHSWPGNIRQLKNVVESATVLATANGGIITPDMLEWRDFGPRPDNHNGKAFAAAPTGTFGDMVNTYREEREWTQKKLADKVTERTAKHYTEEQVQQWEANRVPDQEVVHALAYLLIVNSEKEDKEKAKELKDFLHAADQAREHPITATGATSGFSRQLTQLREAAGLSQKQLAQMTTPLLGETPLTQKNIHLIEIDHPSHQLTPKEALAIVQALDAREHPLSPEDKLKLYESAKLNFSGKTAIFSQERQQYKDLKALLTKNGQIPMTQLAADCDVPPKTLYSLFKGEKGESPIERITAYIRGRDGDAAIPQLLDLLSESKKSIRPGGDGEGVSP